MEDTLRQKRILTYRNADEHIRDLYSNLELGGILKQFIDMFGFQDGTEKVFIDVIGDAILGFFPKSEIKNKLIKQLQMSEQGAQSVVAGLKEYIDQIDGSTLPEANNDVKERLELRPQRAGVEVGTVGVRDAALGVSDGRQAGDVPTQPITVPAAGADAGTRPLTREEVLSSLAPKRTMASDMAAASQADVKSSDAVHGYEAYVSERDKNTT